MNTKSVIYIKVNDKPLTGAGDPYIDLYDGFYLNGKRFYEMFLEPSEVPFFDLKDPDSPLFFKRIRFETVHPEWGFPITMAGWDAYEQVEVIEKGASSKVLPYL